MTALLILHTIIVIALIGVILMQRSSQDGFTGSGGGTGLVSSRGAANALTKTTKYLAIAFITSSLALAWLATRSSDAPSLADQIEEEDAATPATPKKEGELSVPLAE